MALVYTDYGYGHVDLSVHMKDLEFPQSMLESIISQFRVHQEVKSESQVENL